MNIYHFVIDRGQWDTENWITVADDVDIAKEKVYASWMKRFGDPIMATQIEFKTKLDNAEIYVYGINDAVDIWQSFD